MGDVYSAWDEELRRRVALKLIRPRPGADVHAQVLAEARALARLRHPHVVAVHDVGQEGRFVFVAMALLDGLDLRAWSARAQPDAAATLSVMLQCAQGLAAAHEAGLVHHDVKPSNIVVEARESGPWASLIDFGLAADPEDAGGLRGGTPAYMAPECREGQGGSAAADQWSLALVVVELLTGTRPPAEALEAGRVGACGRASAVLRRALRSEPHLRYESVGAFAKALERAAGAPVRSWVVVAGAVVLAAATAYAGVASEPTCQEQARARLDALAPESERLDDLARLSAEDPEVGRSAGAMVQRWRTRWLEQQENACVASAPEAVQACLDGQAREVSALLEVSTADGVDGGGRWQVLGSLSARAEDAACDRGDRVPLTEGMARAFALEVASRFDDAYALASAELESARARGDASTTIGALYRLASVERRRDEAKASLGWGEQAMHLAAEHGDAWTQARALTERVEAWIALGEYARAMEAATVGRTLVAAAGDAPELLSYWHYAQGRALEASSRFDEAAQSYERSLEIRRQTQPRSLYVADAMRSLGYVQLRANRCEAGLPKLDDAIAIYREVLGPGSPSEAQCLSPKSQCQVMLGDVEAGLESSRRAMAIIEATLGPTSEALAKIATLRGATFGSLGDYAAAREPFQRAFEVRQRGLGPDHPETIVAASNLGWILLTLEDLDAAAPILEGALEAATALRGPDHPDNGTLLGALGALHHARGDDETALVMQARALAAHEASPESSNPMTLVVALANLGELQLAVDKLADADASYARAWSILDRESGGHRHVAWPSVNLARGRLAQQAGDAAGADGFFAAALQADPELAAEVAAARSGADG